MKTENTIQLSNIAPLGLSETCRAHSRGARLGNEEISRECNESAGLPCSLDFFFNFGLTPSRGFLALASSASPFL
jgi:hypothetical protein